METSLKTGFAQIFSCCPKNLSCPNFGEAAAPLAPPARTPMLSLVTSLQKISSTGAETAGIRGSRFISAQLQAEKLKNQLEKEEQVTSCFRFVCNKVWSITFSRNDLVSSFRRHQDVAQHLNQFRQDEALILKWTKLCRFLQLDSVDTLL